MKIDPLVATASDLQGLLGDNRTTSVELVELYLDQIEKHNQNGAKIGAIISTLAKEEALKIAHQLDDERAEKGSRGPMHGIPVIVKDVFLTPSLGLKTSCGSYALKDLQATKDARVIDALVAAGMIVIGKANLSELGNYKGYKIPAGWSAVGGQVQSPYVRGGILPDALPLGHSTPAGSSSGSAAGVASGFSPISIGTETDGSLVQPATRAALYGMKGTLGSVDTFGVQPISPVLDCIGGMAKSPKDLASLFNVLQPTRNYEKFLTGSWENLKIGVVDPLQWQPADFIVEPREDFLNQSLTAFHNAISELTSSGGHIVEPVSLIQFPEIFEGAPDGITDTSDFMAHDFREAFGAFLKLYNSPSMQTLQDLVRYNEQHPDLEFPPESPGQEVLLNALDNAMSDETYSSGLKYVRQKAVDSISQLFEEHSIDIVIGPSDGRMASVAAVAGFPVATVPLGLADFNGRAFGANIISTANNEGKILQFMSIWEKTFPNVRIPPPLLSNWNNASHI
ncbi:amidase signature domain-containing protein [Talaromyces proteolyticus]|uniref:Amidase signature domain-containing protein n=1 Tax=Talaromyces proteolyticus TaxID=1131652 RepID=A0AAD4L405_9EURO|nr:amidase signature domain-containing protein [Talaromyces proteolyticus]KAH8704214.1 amidase signature domain-containing protein [Talaromyces proteolyticus]